MTSLKILETSRMKIVNTRDYNYQFDKETGFFQRWGKTKEDDPTHSQFGPEILDLEISVNGCPNNCSWCYKSNSNSTPTNMSLDTFKQILSRMPKTLTQIALGITGVQTNPDMIPIMEHSREKGVIPNFTLTGLDLTDEIAEQCSKLVGALAVSVYPGQKEVGYNTIDKFIKLGVYQTNMHLMVSEETLPFVNEVLKDRMEDDRLKNMNAIVFLAVKPKGRALDTYHPLSTEGYKKLIEHCLDKKISFGFDSCGAIKYERAIGDMDFSDEEKKRLIQFSESCESSLFSAYIDVNGNYWPCSFCEDQEGITPINVLDTDVFLKDVWHHPKTIEFREKLIATCVNGCRCCPVFEGIND